MAYGPFNVGGGGTGKAADASYDNTNSGGTATTVQAALDELYQRLPFSVGATAPADTRLLWIDTDASAGGLKYHNGTQWVHVPVAYT